MTQLYHRARFWASHTPARSPSTCPRQPPSPPHPWFRTTYGSASQWFRPPLVPHPWFRNQPHLPAESTTVLHDSIRYARKTRHSSNTSHSFHARACRTVVCGRVLAGARDRYAGFGTICRKNLPVSDRFHSRFLQNGTGTTWRGRRNRGSRNKEHVPEPRISRRRGWAWEAWAP